MNQPKANPFFEEVNLAKLGVYRRDGLDGTARMEVHSLCEMMLLADETTIDDEEYYELRLHCHTTDGTWDVETFVQGSREGIAKFKGHFTEVVNTLLSDLAKSPSYGTWYLEALAKYVLANDMQDFKRKILKLDAHITDGVFTKEYGKDRAEPDLETWHEQLWAAEELVDLSKVGVTNEQLALARQVRHEYLYDMDALRSALHP